MIFLYVLLIIGYLLANLIITIGWPCADPRENNSKVEIVFLIIFGLPVMLFILIAGILTEVILAYRERGD